METCLAGYGDTWGLVTLNDGDIDSLTFDWSNKEKDIKGLTRAFAAYSATTVTIKVILVPQ